VTLVPPFRVDCELPVLIAAVKVVARETEHMLAEVIGKNIRPGRGHVALIRPPNPCWNAHSRLIEALMPLGWSAKEPHYNGEGFRLHITDTRERHVRLGERFHSGADSNHRDKLTYPPFVTYKLSADLPLSTRGDRHRHGIH
jgi:hypothetical protein